MTLDAAEFTFMILRPLRLRCIQESALDQAMHEKYPPKSCATIPLKLEFSKDVMRAAGFAGSWRSFARILENIQSHAFSEDIDQNRRDYKVRPT